MLTRYHFYALRPSQWLKNLFIFMPLIFGQKLLVSEVLIQTSIGFVLFCLMSSSVYLINDLMDVSRDKSHRTKKLRPIASGRVSLADAKKLATALFIVTSFVGFIFNRDFSILLVAYFLFNLLYSLKLKDVVILDAFSIAISFLFRIIGGTIIAKVVFSHWMIFMVMLLALFLAFNKRRQELKLAQKNPELLRSVLKKYSPYFIDQMIAVVTSSIVVVYMLYTIDDRTVNEFGTNHLIYSIPFVYYGIFRYLYLIHQWRLGEDPTSVLVKDRMMQLNVMIWLAVCICVIYFKL